MNKTTLGLGTVARSVLIVGLLFVVAIPGFCQGTKERAITVTGKNPVIDGSLTAGEYVFFEDNGTWAIAATVTDKTVFLGFSGTTSGWVSIGYGSVNMNNAIFCIGYIKNLKTDFDVQKGAGHSHSKLVSHNITMHAMSEKNGKTVLEIAISRTDLLAQKEFILPVLVAYGKNDDFYSFHAFREIYTFSINE
ncbi:MAG: hypothetical protein JW904_02400 [Spirochaetales bacterium]|nr:hypothetical protein [Spirochaetales bacterium]